MPKWIAASKNFVKSTGGEKLLSLPALTTKEAALPAW
jgi:hypothetical protein